jgi:acyl-CoA thioester hydrolase
MSPDEGHLPNPKSTVFETFLRVRFHEVDSLGHANNASYLNYVEQAAIDHAAAVGIDLGVLRKLGGVFVARRHEIEFVRSAFAGEVLRLVTWLAEPHGAVVVRHYRIFRDPHGGGSRLLQGAIVPAADADSPDGLIVRAATDWVFVSETGTPRRIPRAIRDAFEIAG